MCWRCGPGEVSPGSFEATSPIPASLRWSIILRSMSGSAPAASPAVLCEIAHMQTGEGVWYPMGGTRAIPEALVALAESLGVEFRRNVRVERIVTARGKVCGLLLEKGSALDVDAVISNCDTVRTHRELLGGAASSAFEKRRRYEPACSGVVLYLGLTRRYNHLLHHNFVFSHDPDVEFRSIYQKGQPAPDPTCYVCAPSVTDPAVAPDGGEALCVLVHTPCLRPDHDWGKMLPEYRRATLEKLETHGGERRDIESRIVFERDPEHRRTSDRRYRALDGAIYGLASHGHCLGALKPGNRSPDARGLDLAGRLRGSRSGYADGAHVGLDRWLDTLDRDAADNLVAPGRR